MEKEQKAVNLVREYLQKRENLVDENEVKVVWFCKTLKNWKAMVAHLTPGGMFFEVTYNGEKNETYLDAYQKIENVRIPD